mmetsp:Transcript_62766/g.152832  ORF Transcript_62766/g.152832 Transcript_62766/m.152832 type:complete len:969 (+) Transcript_62766:111-3017(+)
MAMTQQRGEAAKPDDGGNCTESEAEIDETGGRLAVTLSQSASRIFDTMSRSIQEDWPLWMGSLWLVWKSRRQDDRSDISIHSQNHQRSRPNEIPTGNLSSVWPSIPWSLFVDLFVVGSVLTYKKSRELLTMIDHRKNSSNSNRTQQNIDPNENPTATATTKTVNNSDKIRGQGSTNGSHDPSSLFPPPLSTLNNNSNKNFNPEADDHDKVNELRRLLMNHGQQQSSQQQQQQQEQQRYIELLVHNVSHTDLVLSLDAPAPPSSNGTSGDQQKDKNDTNDDDNHHQFCLCRPRFSAFDAYSQRVLDYLKDQNNVSRVLDRKEGAGTASNNNNVTGATSSSSEISTESLISFPLYERSDEPGERYRIKAEQTVTKDTIRIPTGFQLGNDTSHTATTEDVDSTTTMTTTLKITTSELNDLRFRGRDAPRVQNLPPDEAMSINAVFFPLLSTLLPLWKSKIQEKYSGIKVKQVLILVSGVGTPRNWSHSRKGNSTQQCAAIMKKFLKALYPKLIVVHVHSETNIFRYDENITFVQKELLPRIQEYRDAHAKGLPYPDEIITLDGSLAATSSATVDRPFSTEWRKSFSVTLSFADGSPARTHAIQAALRSFRPTYFHFWQLKTFWHEMKVVERDIEVHSFEEMETQPPIETSQLDDQPLIAKVVEEMKAFRNEMVQILSSKNDINSFWLRKTHKPVLAVLAVETKEGDVKLYRGTNMEVSMPTGSLCAERNVIGTALARNPALRRQDLKMIAVLAVPNPDVESTDKMSRPISRPISTVSLTSQQQQHTTSNSNNNIASDNTVNPASFLVPTEMKEHPRPPLIPSSRKSSVGNEDDWIQQDIAPFSMPRTVGGAPIILGTPPIGPIPSGSINLPPSLALDPKANSGGGGTYSGPPTPGRRYSLYDKTSTSTSTLKPSKQRTTVIVRSDDDMNPLAPCGACNEWLKKIAECNPYFTILTFTDSNCHGVFCQPCQE